MSTKILTGLLTLFFVACSATPSAQINLKGESNGIIGGTPVVASSPLNSGIVGIYDQGVGAICTGSLLSNNIILTAAHCVGPDATKMYVIFAADMVGLLEGGNSQQIRQLVRAVNKAVVNPGWDAAANEKKDYDWHDLALLHFQGTTPSGFTPAKFLADPKALTTGAEVALAGYGVDKISLQDVDPKTYPKLDEAITHEEVFCNTDKTECKKVGSSGSGLLRTVDVKISSDHVSEIVLDQTKGQGACSGDSGGPAYVLSNGQYYLWGITSRGTLGCGDEAIYTNALTYRAWIDQASASLQH